MGTFRKYRENGTPLYLPFENVREKYTITAKVFKISRENPPLCVSFENFARKVRL